MHILRNQVDSLQESLAVKVYSHCHSQGCPQRALDSAHATRYIQLQCPLVLQQQQVSQYAVVLKLGSKKVKGKERVIHIIMMIVRSFPLTFLPFEATTTSKLLELWFFLLTKLCVSVALIYCLFRVVM